MTVAIAGLTDIANWLCVVVLVGMSFVCCILRLACAGGSMSLCVSW